MKNAIKNIVITFIIVATAIAVAEWSIRQLEEGYTPSYPTKLDKQWVEQAQRNHVLTNVDMIYFFSLIGYNSIIPN